MDRRRRLPSLTHSNATGTFPGAFVIVPTMTDHTTNEHPEVDPTVRNAWETFPDHRLATIDAHAGAINVEITLCIPGATIVGTTMSYNEFADIERSKIRSVLNQADIEPGDGLPENYAELISNQFFPNYTFPEDEAEAINEMPPTALHLKNVRMVGNGYTHLAPLEVERLRIPIAQITSWCIGHHD